MLPKFKDTVELVKKGATVEAQEKIMELREEFLELREQNLALREAVSSLESQLSDKHSMRFESPFYYKDGDKTPFCPTCYETDGKQIHLQPPYRAARTGGKTTVDVFQCLSCGQDIVIRDKK